jgi:hypothetical protein
MMTSRNADASQIIPGWQVYARNYNVMTAVVRSFLWIMGRESGKNHEKGATVTGLLPRAVPQSSCTGGTAGRFYRELLEKRDR